MKEKHYRITWTIDEFASTPEEAAELAFDHMQKPTEATVFDVEEVETEEKVQVDLCDYWNDDNEELNEGEML